MEPGKRMEVVAKIDAIIARLEAAHSDEEAAPARDELAEVWPDLIAEVPIVGRLMAAQFGDKGGEIRHMDTDGLREKMLPGLMQYRDFLAKGVPGGAGSAPRNVATRPGCFGGTPAVLLLLMLALHLWR